MKYLIILFIGSAGLWLTFNPSDQKNQTEIPGSILDLIADPESRIAEINQDIDFWTEKLSKDDSQDVHAHQLALAYKARFDLTKSIGDLYESKDLLERINNKQISNASFLRSLTGIYISLHQFDKAEKTIHRAIENGEKKRASFCMLFDVQMERGQFIDAEKTLQEIYQINDFDYLIRLAKWKDYKGQLQDAIANLEKALYLAEDTNNKSQLTWLLANLGDFYMHDGRIESSVESYKAALRLDPYNYYSLKGMAWLAFVNDENPMLAADIITEIMTYQKAPELHLFLADVYDHLEKDEKKRYQMQQFMEKSQGIDMYRLTRAAIHAEENQSYELAILEAMKEIEVRNTPETKDLLAWIYYLAGDLNKAKSINEESVLGHTFEPVALFHTAKIHKHFGAESLVASLKRELLTAELELGPGLIEEIKNL